MFGMDGWMFGMDGWMDGWMDDLGVLFASLHDKTFLNRVCSLKKCIYIRHQCYSLSTVFQSY